jgi:hypothetical protein
LIIGRLMMVFTVSQGIGRGVVALMVEEVKALPEDEVVAEVDAVDVVVFQITREVAIEDREMMKMVMAVDSRVVSSISL